MGALTVALSIKRVVGFLTSPAGKFLLILLALFAWTVYHRMDATAECEADELARDLAEAQRQASIAQTIADKARERANASDREMSLLEQENAQLKQDVENGKVGTCVIPYDVRERLLRIR